MTAAPRSAGLGVTEITGSDTKSLVMFTGSLAALWPKAPWTTDTEMSEVDHRGGVTLKVAWFRE
jgi:hypothetical protein